MKERADEVLESERPKYLKFNPAAAEPVATKPATAEPATDATVEAGTNPQPVAPAGGLGDSVKAATAEAATAEAATAKSDVVDLTREYVSATQQNRTLIVQIGGEEIEVVVVRKDEYQRAMKKTAEASDDQKIINKARAAARALNKEDTYKDFMSRLVLQRLGVCVAWQSQVRPT